MAAGGWPLLVLPADFLSLWPGPVRDNPAKGGGGLSSTSYYLVPSMFIG